MTASLRAFDALIAALHGAPCREAAWPDVLALANRSLTTTSLAARLSAAGATLPPDVASFLNAVLARNRLRNARLLGQLAELADAFEDQGIEAIAIKGAAILLRSSERTLGDRMLSDLDILVAPADFPRANRRLRALGYEPLPSSDPEHLVSVLGRAEDAATIDLHGRLVGANRIDPFAGARWHPLGRRGRLAVPSPTVQVGLLLAHDIVRGQDYLGGLLDLRHALDIDELARSGDGIDWNAVAAAVPRRLAVALSSRQIELRQLLGTSVPPGGRSWRARLQVRRRRLQIAYPRLRPALVMASIVVDPLYLRTRRAFLSGGHPPPLRAAGLRRTCAASITGKL